jgi:hypothetical protein
MSVRASKTAHSKDPCAAARRNTLVQSMSLAALGLALGCSGDGSGPRRGAEQPDLPPAALPATAPPLDLGPTMPMMAPPTRTPVTPPAPDASVSVCATASCG